MSEETKTADELSDEQLKKVAGGNRNDTGTYRVKSGGAKLYSEPEEDDLFLLDTISAGTQIFGRMFLGEPFLYTRYNSNEGYVLLNQLTKIV